MEYRPRIVSWNITGACNLRCPHCYLDAGRRWPAELTTEEGLRLIAQMAQAGTELLPGLQEAAAQAFEVALQETREGAL